MGRSHGIIFSGLTTDFKAFILNEDVEEIKNQNCRMTFFPISCNNLVELNRTYFDS